MSNTINASCLLKYCTICCVLILIKHEKGKEEDKMYIVIYLAEYFLEDSDLEGLSDITVSSVHTSDLSSFEGESDNEVERSDSSEEGELPSDGLYCLQFLKVLKCCFYQHRF